MICKRMSMIALGSLLTVVVTLSMFHQVNPVSAQEDDFLVYLPLIFAESDTPGPGAGIVIDHEDTDTSELTQAQLNAARDVVALFNHRSIGNNILDGMRELEAQDPTRYTINIVYSSGTSPGINHYMAGSNGDPMSKINGFAAIVRDGHDAAFMKFCVGDMPPFTSSDPAAVWEAYRDMMIAEQAEHPGTVLVWWTIPLTTQSDARGLANFAEFNDSLRAYVAENGGILFDLADIESHDPNGNPITQGGFEAMYNGYSDDGAHLNATGRQRVARAMWHLLVELAE